jgi:hypothetical protein
MPKLEQKLDELLAREWGVRPEDITDDLLRQKRKEFYERPDFKFGPDFIPLTMRHLKLMTPLEIKAMSERADAFLDQFH